MGRKCRMVGGAGQRGIKGRKNWDNCNSIINKIYLKIKQKRHEKKAIEG